MSRQQAKKGKGQAARGPGVPWIPVAVVAGLALVVGVLAYVVMASMDEKGPNAAEKAEADDDPNLPGVYYPPQGRDHFPQSGTVRDICEEGATDTSTCYVSNPPTSGPHDPVAIPWGIHTAPKPKEQAIHSMEHGGVVVWYNCQSDACTNDVLPQLDALVFELLDKDGRLMVMMPYEEMEPDTIALTVWTRLDKFPASEYTDDRVRSFVTAHERRFNPENFMGLNE